jgi:FixJ family two-component response regulator
MCPGKAWLIGTADPVRGNMLLSLNAQWRPQMTADNHRGAVAIVDDDPEVLASFQFLLEVAGHAVDAYASATAFLEDRAARPSCLILDQHMPTMTGLELAARLRADRADIPCCSLQRI